MPTVLHARVVSAMGGGPDKTILNSPRFLDSAGYRLICAYMHPPGDPGFENIRERARSCDANLIGVPDRGAFDVRVARDMLRICRSQQVDIWHAHDYKSNLLGLLLRPFWPMRLVTTVHGWVQFTARLNWYYAVDRRSLRHYERVICVSDDLQERCRQAGVNESRCIVVQNAIDCDEFSRRRSVSDAKQHLGLPADRWLVGAVGRLSEEKGFDRLILAMDQLLSSGVDAQLCILGEGAARGELEALVARLGRQDRVWLLGYRSNTIEWYQAMDVFALSSLREGTPNVVLEAMAMEVPLVATRVAGVPTLIENGVNGLLVEPDDVGGLTQALTKLLSDHALRERLGAAGRQTVEAKYSFALRMEKIRAIYDELLGRTPAAGSEPQTDGNPNSTFRPESLATT
ncbi:MAG TPA: glycosyltransferase family 4 protein [Pirellulales bacterium]|nr:glycosyltransferase family 4 protein [Pirellulales bacterium]